MSTRGTGKGTAVEIGYSRGTEEKRLRSTPGYVWKLHLYIYIYIYIYLSIWARIAKSE